MVEPYYFNAFFDELFSSSLSLFISSPNNRNNYGQYREAWVINPSINTEIQMGMFKAFGSIIGINLKNEKFVPTEFCPIFWKQILDESVNREDLSSFDLYCTQWLDYLDNIEEKGITRETCNEVINIYFVTKLSDGSEVELKEKRK